MRLVQVKAGDQRRVGIVDEPKVRLLHSFDSVYELAWQAITNGQKLTELVSSRASDEALDYEAVYAGTGKWKLLPPADVPGKPGRCLVSGTGLTHLGSAKNRQAMHANTKGEAPETDSMKMFRWGVQSGKPVAPAVGIAPEWFYKGNGSIVRAHGEPVRVPAFAEDGGEEAEMVGIYLIGPDGKPWRIGMSPGNDFADHIFEKKNYLNLAGSKLRDCPIGPEISINADFRSIPGKVAILRKGAEVWSSAIMTGEDEMNHSLRNLEHHHFKFAQHRSPGDLHLHFLGADALSFGQGIRLGDGDVMQIEFQGFGRPLSNPVHIIKGPQEPVEVRPLS